VTANERDAEASRVVNAAGAVAAAARNRAITVDRTLRIAGA
jgi:hypothetical protein